MSLSQRWNVALPWSALLAIHASLVGNWTRMTRPIQLDPMKVLYIVETLFSRAPASTSKTVTCGLVASLVSHNVVVINRWLVHCNHQLIVASWSSSSS